MVGAKEAIDRLKAEIPADKFKGYILDLRKDPGGLLDQSIAVVNDFIDPGEIVSTRGRTPEETLRSTPLRRRHVGRQPLVVLIYGGIGVGVRDRFGPLQDHKRATLIDTRSLARGRCRPSCRSGRTARCV